MFTGLKIAAQGIKVQRTRLNVTASNIANASTTRTPEGGPYKRQEAVFATTYAKPMKDILNAPVDDRATLASLRGVEVQEVRRDPVPGPLVHNPGHPDADENGFVEMPNINPVEEMVDMITAAHSFEANIQSFQTMREMMMRALNLGR
jgi:flagellar basal-body rod protein FlgC